MQTKRSDNLCNVYILPLLNLTRNSFGERSNFVNSYITHDRKNLVVEVKKLYSHIFDHVYYVTDMTAGDKTYVIFSIPSQYEDTVKKFVEGKYSQFDPNVKHIIKTRSGLKYKLPVANNKVSTARELLALDKDPDLKETLEKELDVKISKDAELMSIPSEENFLDVVIEPVAS